MQRGEPVEDLISIEVNPGEENKTIGIGSNLKEDTKLELVNLLRTYADIFAWTAADMPGIDPEVISHRLNVDPSKKHVKQKKKTFAPGRQEKIEEETVLRPLVTVELESFSSVQKVLWLSMHSVFGFQASNNEMEYEALLTEIRLAHALKVDSLSVHSDSLLVVNHVLGDYEARDERMAQYLQLVKTLASKFKNFTIQRILRDQNTQADTLSRLASSEVPDVRRSVYLKFLKERSISSQTEIRVVDQEPCWMDIIFKYLSTGELPSKRHEGRNLCVKAARYVLVEEVLYKKPSAFLTSGLTEAESLATITSAKCEDFFWKNVVCRFGVPKALVVDNGKQFDDNNFQTFCTNLSINLRFTSVAHPQSNGQTENMNHSILQGLKKKLDEVKAHGLMNSPRWFGRTEQLHIQSQEKHLSYSAMEQKQYCQSR
ncbi:hypothetical protein RJ639_018302 [Escallonia herrerae]|uniref:Integrase catalytic domain-containing protein n=1 Tax=Escallonia herrerae TaxID=1293975 RepID=A0AA88VBW9_9ASTE|nr:hypothetical protein RJ639_018302 [Escallonia herrerae]